MHQGIIEHMIPGRMRLRFREQRRNASFFRNIRQELEQLPEVDRVLVNPLTGSVLIFHSGSPEEISARAGARRVSVSGELRDARLFSRYVPRPQTLAFGGLALYQLVRGRFANSATEQFWHAKRAATLGQPPVAIGMAALGLLQLFGGRWLAPASSFLMYALMTELSTKTRKNSPPYGRFARLPFALPRFKGRSV